MNNITIMFVNFLSYRLEKHVRTGPWEKALRCGHETSGLSGSSPAARIFHFLFIFLIFFF